MASSALHLVLLAALAATASASSGYGADPQPKPQPYPEPEPTPRPQPYVSSPCEAELKVTGILARCQIANAKALLEARSKCCREVISERSACVCPAVRGVLAGKGLLAHVTYPLLQEACGGGAGEVCSGCWNDEETGPISVEVSGVTEKHGCRPVDGDTLGNCDVALTGLKQLKEHCLYDLVGLKGRPGGCYVEGLAYLGILEYASVVEKLCLRRY
ncbi:hypothetical protein ACP4OV_020369 [Aristida adscensionis]